MLLGVFDALLGVVDTTLPGAVNELLWVGDALVDVAKVVLWAGDASSRVVETALDVVEVRFCALEVVVFGFEFNTNS